MALPDGLFASAQVHEREVTLGDGTKHTLFFKELPAVKFAAYHEAKNSSDADKREGAIAKLFVASLCEPDGSPALSYEQALTIKPGPANEIMTHILSVNGYGADEKKG